MTYSDITEGTDIIGSAEELLRRCSVGSCVHVQLAGCEFDSRSVAQELLRSGVSRQISAENDKAGKKAGTPRRPAYAEAVTSPEAVRASRCSGVTAG